MAPVVKQGVRRQTEGVGGVVGIHGRGFQSDRVVQGTGNHWTDQHQRFGALARPAVQIKADAAGERAPPGPAGMCQGQLQLSAAQGLSRGRPEGRRAKDCGALERVPLDLSA